jgi:hypothetical protein
MLEHISAYKGNMPTDCIVVSEFIPLIIVFLTYQTRILSSKTI